jgi:hypothetical protein
MAAAKVMARSSAPAARKVRRSMGPEVWSEQAAVSLTEPDVAPAAGEAVAAEPDGLEEPRPAEPAGAAAGVARAGMAALPREAGVARAEAAVLPREAVVVRAGAAVLPRGAVVLDVRAQPQAAALPLAAAWVCRQGRLRLAPPPAARFARAMVRQQNASP